jgi:hypothetical protein
MAAWIAKVSRMLEPSQLTLKQWVICSRLDHVDETEIRVRGLMRWMHMTVPTWLTLFCRLTTRGQGAIDLQQS